MIFPKALIRQEMSTDRWIDIPEEVRDIYRLWRPTPLFRAAALEKASRLLPRSTTNMRVSARQEAISPIRSSQAYYSMKEGIERLATETGAGSGARL